MCDPNTIATNSQIRSALYVANETNRLANEFNTNLANGYKANMVQLQEQRGQMQDQAQQEQSAIAKQVAAERARMATIIGETGVDGNTAQRIMNEAAYAGDVATANSQRNLNNALEQTQRTAEALRRQAIASRKVGTSWDGLNLQIQGIQAQGYAANANRLLSDAQVAALKPSNNYGLAKSYGNL